MTDRELEFAKSRLSEGYISLLESGSFEMALTLYRAEKLHFKHALNLILYYFRKNFRLFQDFQCNVEVDLGFFVLEDQYYKWGDMKIAFVINEFYNVKLWIGDKLVLSFIFTEADEGYGHEDWLSIIADKIMGLHHTLKLNM
jgi:hypothetical protein